jgi:hypothetical protein
VAVWTGSAFFVWGGVSNEDKSALNCGSSRPGDGCEARYDGSLTLDLETKVFSPLSLPEEVRACWSGITPVFEAARVVLIAPAGCGGHEASVSALDPHHGTWKTAILPPVPRPHVPAAAQRSGFGGRLVWTGDQIVAWGDSFAIGEDTSCLGAPRNMPCDPVGPPMQQTSDGFILRPPL